MIEVGSPIIVNGVKFVATKNPFYKRGNFQAKYRVNFYDDYYGLWRFVYAADNKRELTIKNIKKYFLYW